MADRETQVRYKALADFANLKKSIREAKKALEDLRDAEKSENEQSKKRASDLKQRYADLTDSSRTYTNAIGEQKTAVKELTQEQSLLGTQLRNQNRTLGQLNPRMSKYTTNARNQKGALATLTKAQKEQNKAVENTFNTLDATNDMIDTAMDHQRAYQIELANTADAVSDVNATQRSMTRALSAKVRVRRETVVDNAPALPRTPGFIGPQTRSETRRIKFIADTDAFLAKLRGVERGASRVSGLLDKIGNWRPRLTPPFIALVPLIASVIALINPLVAGLGAIGAAAGAVVADIGSLAGGALVLAPALAGLVSAFAGTKIAFNGVGGAFKALKDAREEAFPSTGDPVLDAMARLTPSARTFVKDLDGMAGAWGDMREVVQENFFTEVAGGVGRLAGAIPALQTVLAPAATSMGKFMNNLIGLVTSPEWTSDMASFGRENAEALDNLGEGTVHLLDGFRNLVMGAMPLWQRFTGAFAEGSEALSGRIADAVADGRLQAWLEDVGDRTAEWWQILKNVAVTISNYSSAMSDFSRSMTGGLSDITEGWRESSEAAMESGSAFREFLDSDELSSLLSNLRGLVGDFFSWFASTASDPANLATMDELVNLLRNELGPAVSDILETLAQSGIGEALVNALSAIIRTIDNFLSAGGATAFLSFLNAIEGAFDMVAAAMGTDIAGPFIAQLAGIAAFFATSAFLTKFLGINAAIRGLGTVLASPAIARAPGIIGSLAASFTPVAGSVGGATRGVGGFLSALGGPWGLAIGGAVTGLVLLNEHFQSMDAQIGDLQESLAAGADSIDVFSQAGSGLFEGFDFDIDQIPDFLEDMAAIDAGGALASMDIGTWDLQMSSFASSLGEIDEAMSGMDFGQMTTGFSDMVNQFDLNSQEAGQLLDQMPLLSAALAEQAEAAGYVVTNQQGVLDSQLIMTAAIAEGTIVVDDQAQSFEDAAASFGNYNSLFATAQSQTASYYEALEQLTDPATGLASLGPVIDATATNFNLQTQAGRDAEAMMANYAIQARESADAMVQFDGDVAGASVRMGEAYTQFVTNANAIGITGAAADQLAVSYGLLPEDVYTAINNGAPNARELVETYIGTLGDVDPQIVTELLALVDAAERDLNFAARNRTSYITAITTASSGPRVGSLHFDGEGDGPGLSSGGVVPGQPSHNDNVYAHVASGEYVTRTRQSLKYRGLLEAINNDTLNESTVRQYLPSISASGGTAASGSMPASIAQAATTSSVGTIIQHLSIHNPKREETTESLARTVRKAAYI